MTADHRDPQWQAHQYLWGELSESEMEEFERQVAADDDLAEQLAAAAELQDLLKAACHTSDQLQWDVPRQTRRSSTVPVESTHSIQTAGNSVDRRQRTRAAIAGLTAAVAGIVALVWFGPYEPSVPPHHSVDQSTQPDDSQLPFEMLFADLAVDELVETTMDDPALSSEEPLSHQLAAVNDVPDWLFAALEADELPAESFPNQAEQQ